MRRILARFEARKGQDAAADFEAAAVEMQKANDLSPEDLEGRITFGRFCVAWASAQKAAGRDPGPPLQRGLDLANQVLAARPAWPDARILRASLLLSRAEAADSPADQREQAARAASDFTGALEANPNLDHASGREAALARRLSAGSR